MSAPGPKYELKITESGNFNHLLESLKQACRDLVHRRTNSFSGRDLDVVMQDQLPPGFLDAQIDGVWKENGVMSKSLVTYISAPVDGKVPVVEEAIFIQSVRELLFGVMASIAKDVNLIHVVSEIHATREPGFMQEEAVNVKVVVLTFVAAHKSCYLYTLNEAGEPQIDVSVPGFYSFGEALAALILDNTVAGICYSCGDQLLEIPRTHLAKMFTEQQNGTMRARVRDNNDRMRLDVGDRISPYFEDGLLKVLSENRDGLASTVQPWVQREVGMYRRQTAIVAAATVTVTTSTQPEQSCELTSTSSSASSTPTASRKTAPRRKRSRSSEK